jgi:hypothetical protein
MSVAHTNNSAKKYFASGIAGLVGRFAGEVVLTFYSRHQLFRFLQSKVVH